MLTKRFKNATAALLLAGATGAMAVLSPAQAQADSNRDAMQSCVNDLNNAAIKMESYITARTGSSYIHTKFGFDTALNTYTGCVYTNQTNDTERVSATKDLANPQESRSFYEMLDVARLRDQNLRTAAEAEAARSITPAAGATQEAPLSAREIERQRRQEEQARRRAEQEYNRALQRQQQQERRCERAQYNLAREMERTGIRALGGRNGNLNNIGSQAIKINGLQNEVRRQCEGLRP